LTHATDQDTAHAIAYGHAFYEHAHEFKVNQPDIFEQIIADILNAPTCKKPLRRGRRIYWDAFRKAVIITDSNSIDCGTAFVPPSGKVYFDNQR
jgi:hypothetical protein